MHQGFALIPSVDVVALRRETQREPTVEKEPGRKGWDFHKVPPAQLTTLELSYKRKCF